MPQRGADPSKLIEHKICPFSSSLPVSSSTQQGLYLQLVCWAGRCWGRHACALQDLMTVHPSAVHLHMPSGLNTQHPCMAGALGLDRASHDGHVEGLA